MTERGQMTKGEREDLIRLVKQRERVAKTAAEQRSAAMLAEFEQKVSALHNWATNDVWKASVEIVTEEVKKAMVAIDAESAKLGIPKEFRPKISMGWQERGENAFRSRREELRRVAKAEIDALEKVARVQIEHESVRAQSEIIANGLNSQAALEFMNRLPAIENMMPALSVEAIQQKLADKARQSRGYSGPYLIGSDE